MLRLEGLVKRSTAHAGSRSIGSYLCDRPVVEPYIDIDRLPWDDIRQDACLRAIVALERAGKPIGPDPVAAFDAEPRLVVRAYRFARRDALRYHLGRGKHLGRNAERWRRLVSLDRGFADVADPAQGEALDAIVERVSAAANLVLVQQRRWGGVSQKRMRRLLAALRRLQRLKESGTVVVSPHLREQISAARRDSGLPIDLRRL